METAGSADRQSDATLDLDQGQLRTLMNPDTNGIYFLSDLHRLISVSHHRVDKAFLQKRLLDAINTALAECDSSNAFRHPVCNASCDWVSAPSFAAKVHCKVLSEPLKSMVSSHEYLPLLGKFSSQLYQKAFVDMPQKFLNKGPISMKSRLKSVIDAAATDELKCRKALSHLAEVMRKRSVGHFKRKDIDLVDRTVLAYMSHARPRDWPPLPEWARDVDVAWTSLDDDRIMAESECMAKRKFGEVEFPGLNIQPIEELGASASSYKRARPEDDLREVQAAKRRRS